LYKIGKNILKLPLWAALFAPLIFGFASTSWSYAITLYQHQVTTFCIIASIYAVWKFKQGKKWSFVWGFVAWTNLSIAISVDYPNVTLMLPVMLYFLFSSFRIFRRKTKYLVRWRVSSLVTSIVFALFVIAQAYFNYTHFGGAARVSNTLASYKSIVEHSVRENIHTDEASKSVDNSRSAAAWFSEYSIPRGFAIQTVGADRGLFLYSPIFLQKICC